MLCKGDSIGVFQVESRAQMNMLPRLKPRRFYDLVIEVAIVRPGPIQGDMVHPYLKRRSGKEKVEYPAPSPKHGPENELRSILERTLGVPIFQEQAMRIALDAARFSPQEANQLRKAMATFRSRGMMDAHEDKMVGRMIERGYDEEFSRRCFGQIKGFGEYGFPESHAASFAHLVYISSWLKCFYPAVFTAALLNSQPMGFYAPAQLVRDAREHGVEVREVDVNFSDWDCTLEPVKPGEYAMRLGFRLIDGMKQSESHRIVSRRDRPFETVEDMKECTGLRVAVLERIASADGFRSMGLDRRQALWDVRALKNAPDLPLFTFTEQRDEGCEADIVKLPPMPLSEHVVSDYQTTRLSLKAHPLHFLRSGLDAQKYVSAARLRSIKNGQRVKLAGVVLIRQRPGSAKGVCFITLEDETGVANLVIWPNIMEKYRSVIMGARLMEVHGIIQMDEDIIHIVAQKIVDASHKLRSLSDNMLEPISARADHVKSLSSQSIRGHPRNHRILPRSRDFH
jgi:error-prone DNA polymerase